jgi:hypothetical protein
MRMAFRLYLLLLIVCASQVNAQTKTISLGIFTGATSSYIWDEGINRDPRYEIRYDIKFAPIGVAYGIDYEGFGFILTPSLIRTGQKYNVINTVGGQEGIRSSTLNYLNLPGAFKFHIIDLSFFKVSFVAGASVAFLLDAKETISHNQAKLRFPSAVYPFLPPDYQVEYDGVIAPKVDNYKMLERSDLNSLQIYGCAGFRSDWDINENWRVSFDFRVNYGFLEPRNSAYLDRLNANQTLYDVPGKRKDIFANFNVGIARYIDIDKKDSHGQKKGSSKYKPKKSSGSAPRKKRPKG